MALLVAALPQGAVAVRHATAVTTYSVDTAREVRSAQQLRAAYGFRADLSFVESISLSALYSSETWGFPVSAGESAEIARRVAIQETLIPAQEYAATAPEWAGAWIDHQAGGEAVFAFAGNPERHRAGLEDRLPAGTAFRLEAVDETLANLAERKDAVAAAEAQLATSGVELTLVGISVSRNTIRIGVHGLNADRQASLQSMFGKDVVLLDKPPAQADACLSMYNCWPTRGGFELQSPEGRPCTSGLLARRTDVSPPWLVVVTAGHCIERLNIGAQNWKHAGNVIGPAVKKNNILVETWQAEANADVGLIRQLTPWPADRTLFILDDSPIRPDAMENTRTAANQAEGTTVCRIGRTWGRDCGPIKDNDVRRLSTADGISHWINHTVEVEFDSTGGDSGGTMFIDNLIQGVAHPVLYGTHVHSDPDGIADPDGWYSPQDQAVSELLRLHGVRIWWCAFGATCGF